MVFTAGCSKTSETSSVPSNPDLVTVLREKGCLEGVYREIDLDFDGVSEVIAYPNVGSTFAINPSVFALNQDGEVQILYQGGVSFTEENDREEQYELEGVVDIYLLTEKATGRKKYVIEWFLADGFCTQMHTISILSKTAEGIQTETLFYDGCDKEAERANEKKYGADDSRVHTLKFLVNDRKVNESDYQQAVQDFWGETVQKILSREDFKV